MLFHSMSFAVFLIIVFILYYLVPNRYRWCFLLAASYAFYMNLHVSYGLLLLATTILTYGLALQLEKAETTGQKRRNLLCGILPLVLILFVFKTASPILDRLNALIEAGRLTMQPFTLRILLPAGVY